MELNITPEITSFEVGGQTITIETGVIAPQASGSVIIKCGETVVFVAATASSQPKDHLDFFPLTVDYESKMYSVGRIPGGFIRREGRPPESSILTSRVIDRQIRPLFPDGFRHDIHVVAQLFSSDQSYQPDVLCMIGASAALSISNIPFDGPTAGVRVGRVDGQWVINPTYEEIEESDLDLIVAGTADSINMVEAGSKMLSEELMLEAIEIAHREIVKITGEIKAFAERVGKPKMEIEYYQLNSDILGYVQSQIGGQILEAMNITDNKERAERIRTLSTELKEAIAALPEDSDLAKILAERPKDVGNAIYKLEKNAMRSRILEQELRADGRSLSEVRPIHSDVGFIPRTHGSGLFVRGTTQAISFTTLGSMSEAQPLDGVDPETSKRYLHHYNFPGYSVGESKPLRSPGRREIGHGNLAERAILPVLPSEAEFPYAIRVVSEIMSSNGSTSMASTCASTLTLMDAGVPIKDMVGGIAMGLIKEGDNYKILTDIQGLEDHLGDMDFKVTGTTEGITALQMDIKIDGLSMQILKDALEAARVARLHILEKMRAVIAKPRPELSPYAPRIITIQINPNKIGDVIGPGGKMIKKIVEETGVKIDIDDSGLVFIVTPDAEAADAAQAWIARLTQEAEVGRIYEGEVVRLTTFGAFIEVIPGQDGLLHISKVPGRPRHIEDVFSIGEKVSVRVAEIDSQGRINLSLEQEVHVPESAAAPPPAHRSTGTGYRPGGGGGGGGGDRDRGGRGGDRRR